MEGMNPSSLQLATIEQSLAPKAPLLLAAGLGLVGLAQFFPLTPVLLGVSLLMLGSTLTISSRIPPQLRLLAMSSNLLVYLTLYGLFLGATLHPSSPAPHSWFHLLDLASSLCPVVLSLQLGLRQIQSA